ncbi:hypothetical protein IFR05_010519 [Cadophora sp. M221]|nr:hypothetical protein IFR05_010519 [Cadophora sp. M221]
MRKSRSLRNSVIGASFDCQNLEHDDHIISEIVSLLSPSTRFIHLKPLTYNPGSDYLSFLTSLEIEADHLGSDYDQAYAERDKLYALFCISNLRSLSVIGVRCWGCFGEVLDSSRVGSSNITFLLFRNSVHAGQDLFEVLTWPKALISFRFELEVDDHMTFGNHRDIMRGGEFSAALLPQAPTLEEIYIYGNSEGDNCGYDLTNIVDLRPFTNLRRVGLHLSLMMVYIADAEFCEEPLEIFPRMYEILPPALEQLQIEMRNEFPSTSFFSSDPCWEADLRAGELSQAVCEIMQNKRDRYPRLRDIIFFQHRSSTKMNLEDISGCSELLQCSKSTGVHVSWLAGNPPPLFSA